MRGDVSDCINNRNIVEAQEYISKMCLTEGGFRYNNGRKRTLAVDCLGLLASTAILIGSGPPQPIVQFCAKCDKTQG